MNTPTERPEPWWPWRLLREPRALTALTMLAYAAFIFIGVTASLDPPTSLSEELGWVTEAWAAMLFGGGLLGVVSAPRGVWWIERIAIAGCGTGTAIYLATVLQIHVASEMGNRLPQMGMIALALIALAGRWVFIRHSALDPSKDYHPPTTTTRLPGLD